MRLVFFALLAVNVAVLILQLTVWRVGGGLGNVEHVKNTRSGLHLASEGNSGVDDASGAPRELSDICTLVGPFPEQLRAEYFVEHVQALEVGASVQSIDVSDGVGYWVYLPPLPSKPQALEKLKEIQAKKIDSYLIPKGTLLHGISLGMFTRSELADLRQNEMSELGYQAEIKEISRTRQEMWVKINRLDAQEIAEQTWLMLLNKEKGIEKRQIYCSAIASE